MQSEKKSTYTSLLGLDEAINVFERTISSVLNDLQRYRKMERSISALEAIIQGLARDTSREETIG